MTTTAKKYPLHKFVQYGNIVKFKMMLSCTKNINEVNDDGYPLLVLACERENNDTILKFLFDYEGIDPYLTNKEGFNALHCLALRGRLVWIKKLFEKFPDFQVDEVTKKGDTALILACKRNHAHVIKFLHDKGANVNKKNRKGYTALQYAASNGYVESTKQFIEIGADIHTKDNYGSTPMMKAVHWGFFNICKILENSVNYQETGYLLHEAVECHNIKKFKILLPLAKDINKKNDEGNPVLVLACEHGNNEILDLLLDCKNIDPYVTNNDNFNALHWLAFKGDLKGIQKLFCKFPDFDIDRVTDKKCTSLILAAKMDHADVIEYLHKRGSNVDHKNNKLYTALLYSVVNGYVNSTLKLIELGADVNVKDDTGFTPLIKAASWGFTEICDILLKNKADISLKNNKGFNALLVAIRRVGGFETVKLLLRNGADPNSRLSATYTALTVACQMKSLDILHLLVKHRADVHFPKPYSAALFCCVKTDSFDCAEVLLKMGVNVHGKDRNGISAISVARKSQNDKMIKLLNSYI